MRLSKRKHLLGVVQLLNIAKLNSPPSWVTEAFIFANQFGFGIKIGRWDQLSRIKKSTETVTNKFVLALDILPAFFFFFLRKSSYACFFFIKFDKTITLNSIRVKIWVGASWTQYISWKLKTKWANLFPFLWMNSSDASKSFAVPHNFRFIRLVMGILSFPG